MPEMKNEGFEFKQCVNILKSTGRKAKGLRELLDEISGVSEGSIFHHTYQYFLKGHILEYSNDFAQWAGENLEERALAEHLSNVDPYDFRSIAEMRNRLVDIIADYLKNFPEPRDAMPGDEFYFNETITIVFSAGIKVRNLAEFLIAIKHIGAASIYFHFYEARIRLGRDDFSKWLEEALGEKDLAARVMAIDPLMHTIEGIREHIVEAVEAEVRKYMEVLGEVP